MLDKEQPSSRLNINDRLADVAGKIDGGNFDRVLQLLALTVFKIDRKILEPSFFGSHYSPYNQ